MRRATRTFENRRKNFSGLIKILEPKSYGQVGNFDLAIWENQSACLIISLSKSLEVVISFLEKTFNTSFSRYSFFPFYFFGPYTICFDGFVYFWVSPLNAENYFLPLCVVGNTKFQRGFLFCDESVEKTFFFFSKGNLHFRHRRKFDRCG